MRFGNNKIRTRPIERQRLKRPLSVPEQNSKETNSARKRSKQEGGSVASGIDDVSNQASESNTQPSQIIEGTKFAVDTFKLRNVDSVNHFFLSHFHADQYVGLDGNFRSILYLSEITGAPRATVGVLLGVNISTFCRPTGGKVSSRWTKTHTGAEIEPADSGGRCFGHCAGCKPVSWQKLFSNVSWFRFFLLQLPWSDHAFIQTLYW